MEIYNEALRLFLDCFNVTAKVLDKTGFQLIKLANCAHRLHANNGAVVSCAHTPKRSYPREYRRRKREFFTIVHVAFFTALNLDQFGEGCTRQVQAQYERESFMTPDMDFMERDRQFKKKIQHW